MLRGMLSDESSLNMPSQLNNIIVILIIFNLDCLIKLIIIIKSPSCYLSHILIKIIKKLIKILKIINICKTFVYKQTFLFETNETLLLGQFGLILSKNQIRYEQNNIL